MECKQEDIVLHTIYSIQHLLNFVSLLILITFIMRRVRWSEILQLRASIYYLLGIHIYTTFFTFLSQLFFVKIRNNLDKTESKATGIMIFILATTILLNIIIFGEDLEMLIKENKENSLWNQPVYKFFDCVYFNVMIQPFFLYSNSLNVFFFNDDLDDDI
ncbi:MAG: hypothetical protein MHMPM18_004279 [Marteilia pararefringens]